MSIYSLDFSEASIAPSRYASRLAARKHATRIIINNHFSSKVYTSSSVISGTVVVETEYDMWFDTLQILLLGMSISQTDSTAGPLQRQHLFLKLQMPISTDQLPVPRIFEAGITYTFPFTFVLPKYLTINACSHGVRTDHVRDAHLLLPPSMGIWRTDDMAPKMARIEYSIEARILKDPEHLGRRAIKLSEKTHPIQVLPASYEEAPLSICKEDKAYRMSRTKGVRKGIFSSKIGDVTATASQPRPIILRPDGRAATGTNAHIELRFDPVSADAQLPVVTGITSKLFAHTYFSDDGFDTFPNIGKWTHEFGQHRRGEYYTSVHLPSTPNPKTKWRVYVTGLGRRDSGYVSDAQQASCSDCESDQSRRSSRLMEPESSHGQNGSSHFFYRAKLSVPISIPTKKKTFIPSFHSCLISRAYVVHLSITIASGSSTTTLSIAVPLQIAVEATDTHEQGTFGLPTFQDVVEQEEAAAADETLTPRVWRVPEVQFSRAFSLPGYDEVNRRHPPIGTY